MESASELFKEIDMAGQLIDNSWKLKQDDVLDQRTSHIYQCRNLEGLKEQADLRQLSVLEQNYALHRWRNFKRHEAWLSLLFEQVPSISLPRQSFHKQQDFIIRSNEEDIPFDLKVTRYPHSAAQDLGDLELAIWFYSNQSRQGRFHLANRFFIVGQPESALYDIELARKTIGEFVGNMSSFRHFIKHPDQRSCRAVLLRQIKLN